MEEKEPFDTVLENLFFFLTRKKPAHDEINIFRKHNNKLNVNGDISFPLNYSAWKKYINENKECVLPILEYINKKSDNSDIFYDLLENSKNWIFPLTQTNIKQDKLNLYLNRQITCKAVISRILSTKENYGKTNLSYKSYIEIRNDNNEDDLSAIDLTQLRIILIRNVLENILNITGNDQTNENREIIYLTNRSESQIKSKKLICGVVTANKFGKKCTSLKAQEFYERRTVDMQLMAQHKYGVRINSETGWKEFLQNLGKAAVAIDLLFGKPNRPIVININNPISPHSKGAPFILYNCARLSTILKQFEDKVATEVYPPLPELSKIDFSLLNQPEEWEILYIYLMNYPHVIKSCVEDITECKINIHNLCTFLDSMCLLFSVYYRRVRILTSPRVHLFPVLQARIYLLKAIKEVFHNTLALLNIPPVKQM